MLRPKFLLAFLAISAALLAQPAYAHGFGERYDLPVPLSYFMVGGGAAVVLSFAMIGVVVKGEAQRFSYPRFNLIRHPLSRLVLAGPVILPIKMFTVFLLGLIVAVGQRTLGIGIEIACRIESLAQGRQSSFQSSSAGKFHALDDQLVPPAF